MTGIDKAQLAGHFGRRADSYDRATPVQQAMAEQLLAGTERRLAGRTITSILEMGCGTGRLTGQLARRFPQARITALDIAPAMVAHARGLLPGVDFRVADAEAYLQADRGVYDIIIANATVQWFEQPRAAMIAARARLAAGGLLAISTFGEQTFRELRHAFEAAYAASSLAKVEHVVPMRSTEDWRRDLPDAQIVEHTIARAFPDVNAFLRSVQEAGAVNSLAGRRFLSRAVLRRMIECYTLRFPDSASGGVIATYHTIHLYTAAGADRQ